MGEAESNRGKQNKRIGKEDSTIVKQTLRLRNRFGETEANRIRVKVVMHRSVEST